VIARRDLRSAFDAPLAYVLIAAFLCVSGALFAFSLLGFSDLSDAVRAARGADPRLAERLSLDNFVVEPTLKYLSFLLLVLVPLLTMRALSEEKRQGTMELLLTAPVSPLEIVVGKFLGAWVLVLAPIAITLLYPLILVALASPDPGLLISGYFGCVLLTATLTSLGLLASSLTSSPVVAAFLGFVLVVTPVAIGVIGNGMSTNLGTVLAWLSPLVHFDALTAGVIDTSDVAYYVLSTVAALFLALRVVESHRWR
jgi:ABC-2 type transport system permease protein